MASSLERCMERLAEVNVQQSTVNKQLFVSGQLSKITIPIFGGDPLQYPACNSAFKRCGNCIVLSMAFISKLEKWPKIGPKDAVASREFSDFLDKILAAKETVPGLSVLDYAKENVKLLAKRPYCLEIKWRDAIKRWRHTHDEAGYATFSKFASFIREAADKANIPELESLSNSSSPNSNS